MKLYKSNEILYPFLKYNYTISFYYIPQLKHITRSKKQFFIYFKNRIEDLVERKNKAKESLSSSSN